MHKLISSLFKMGHPKKRLSTPRPNPFVLMEIWKRLVHNYFPERADLLNYRVCWSARRQKRTLASCHIKQRKVRVARELSAPEHACRLEPLLYHEMCHAVLGEEMALSYRSRGMKVPWHGTEFRALEVKHPKSRELEAWIKGGGWSRAVRSSRARESYAKRR
ncbi:MAG: hypothetical protein DCC75_10975 [Proteobacteria bacterium]|nr:MAG: hypothetical protein DCC75_10975 [Pseudomonadota bacterium]